MTKRAVSMCAAALVACALAAWPAASAASPGVEAGSAASPGVEHLHFRAGPYPIGPGANSILLDSNRVPKPAEDGYMVRMAPNLHYARADGSCCGAVPRVDVIHLHHGVWLSNGAAGHGEGSGFEAIYPFMAAGEEKTIYQLPAGYGYPVGARDLWILNYMIHNLTDKPARVYITYDIDFVPASAPLAHAIVPVHPIWMDVQAGHIYPVFDVSRHSGHDGAFTYPDMAPGAYRGGRPLNEFTVDHAGTLVSTAGHVHPGGLRTELDVVRAGAAVSGGAIPGPVTHSARAFRSIARYFDKRGPISWDMAMTATPGSWRVRVSPGDVLRVSATYETRRASWYESMGIMVVFMAWGDPSGVDPFAAAPDQAGAVTHRHLHENDNHGGARVLVANPRSFRSCSTRTVIIGAFHFSPGDFQSTGPDKCAPTVAVGQSLSFRNNDASALGPGNLLSPNPAYLSSIFHSVTACQNPCGLDTGISYPLANGPGGYDSGQLGIGQPAVGRLTWGTPRTLAPGTYTYFCRIHPFMRGVFRVIR